LGSLSDGDFDALSRIDPVLIEAAGECGLRSFITLGGFLGNREVDARLLAYEAPWGVGYLTALYASPGALDVALGGPESTSARIATPPRGSKGGSRGSSESEIVTLARRTIEEYVRSGAVPGRPSLSDEALPPRAGAFVSIHEGGRLRGCIGTIRATQPTLADEVVHNAVEAATRDPRFPPVGADELDSLDIQVDVLHDAEPCVAADLDPSMYGVIVSCDRRRGLLLPDLEGVDTVDEQIAIARRKAGIAAHEKVRLERFKVDRHA
jgi:AmmeMemoRadiSam system protein A